MRRPASETREHVLAVARDLFYWEGIRATGVDRVAAEAGVSPTTLYRLFASKDDLVAAYVEREAAGYRTWFDAAVGSPDRPPRERVLALFDALAEQVDPAVCRGCPFLIALGELPDAGHPGHRRAAELKAWVRGRLRELVAGAPEPDALADRLALLVDGVYGSVQALGAGGPARQARAAAEALMP
jgi:AcrR family transcriptional regulator